MTDAQLKAWQRHVLYARRRVEQFQVAGNPTGVPVDAAILAADKVVQAARTLAAAVDALLDVTVAATPNTRLSSVAKQIGALNRTWKEYRDADA